MTMPDPTLTACLDDLAQTLEAATPGPWTPDGYGIEAEQDTVCVMGEIDGWESGYKPCENSTANAQAIALLRNLGDDIVKSWRELARIQYEHNRAYDLGPCECRTCQSANAIHAALLAAREE